MSQEDGPIDVDAFDLDAEAMGKQTIGASIPIAAGDSQHIANQTAAPGSAFLLPPQFPAPTQENQSTRLEYHPVFGYYPLNPPPPAVTQSFLPQTPPTATSNFLSAPTSAYTGPTLPSLSSTYAPPMLPSNPTSSPSPTPTRALVSPPAPIPIQTIFPSAVSADLPTACGERGGRGSRGGQGRGSRGAKRGGRSAGPNVAPQDQAPAPGNNEDADAERTDEEQPTRKRGRNRNMNAREKLVLIRECCEHMDEYRPGNKTKFWAMISELLKQHTGYDLMHPQQTITRWVKARIDELVEEEMGSGTEVERNDFKAAVEQFAQHMDTVAQDIEDSVKSRQQKAAENLEAARLENALIFEIDDEPISGVDTPNTNRSSTPGSSIALNPRQRKRKREHNTNEQRHETQPAEASQNAVLIANSFRDSTAVLADALRYRQEANIAPAPATAPAATPTATATSSENNKLSQRISNLEQKVDGAVSNMEGMMGRIMQALAGLNAAAGLGLPTM